MLGKMYWYFENAKDAMIYFKKASKIINKTYGYHHPLVSDLYEKIKLSEMELSFKKEDVKKKLLK
jgi:hypothetical protein